MRWIIPVLAWASAALAEPAAVSQLAVVSGTTCALHADGAVSCWGRELDRSLPNAPIHDQPAVVTTFGDGVVQLEGVFLGICARYRDGSVSCRGMSAASGAKLERQPLHDVANLRGTCARTSDGRVTCFDGKVWSSVPGLDDAVDAHGYNGGGCAIHKDATVSCWTATDAPQLVPGVKQAVQVSQGFAFACARLRDGRVSCWGDNSEGSLGRGRVEATVGGAASVPGVTDAVDLMTGATDACIRRKTGAMSCWGHLYWADKTYASVTAIRPLEHITAFAGGDQVCAAGRGHDVWCMGGGRNGELGNGVSAIADVAREIPGVHDAIQIFASTLGTCAVRKTGAVTCWGVENEGPLKLPPVRAIGESIRTFSGRYLTGLDARGRLWVNGESSPRELPVGTAHAATCVIAHGGEVWCNAIVMGRRGKPGFGRLAGVTDAVELAGNPMLLRHRSGAISTFSVDTAISGGAPVDVPAIDDAISIAAGGNKTCAVRADHTAWCWSETIAPAALPGVTGAVSLAISSSSPVDSTGFMCAVKVDGSVACWGENSHGQLGTRTGIASKTPLAIRGVHDAVQVAAGWMHACALEKSGAIACWGSTEEGAGGQLPTSRVDRPVPVLWP